MSYIGHDTYSELEYLAKYRELEADGWQVDSWELEATRFVKGDTQLMLRRAYRCEE